jgi:hypothetical protein
VTLRKTSQKNKVVQLYPNRNLKPPINFLLINFHLRNPSSTMNEMEIELNGADQTASTKANTADAANGRGHDWKGGW